MNELVLDASFALRWCFEDGATNGSELLLSMLQNQTRTALVPVIWKYEMLNGLGKGVARGRLNREKALLFWRALTELPIHVVDVPVDEKLLELALKHHIAVYDASYLSLAHARGLPIATIDGKLQQASENSGIEVILP